MPTSGDLDGTDERSRRAFGSEAYLCGGGPPNSSRSRRGVVSYANGFMRSVVEKIARSNADPLSL